MAVGMFLKISAIKGESRDGAHTRSFSAQACRPQTARLEWPSGSSHSGHESAAAELVELKLDVIVTNTPRLGWWRPYRRPRRCPRSSRSLGISPKLASLW
jgi:hypothetical protein